MKSIEILLALAVCCFAQTLVSSLEESGNCVNSTIAYDIENYSQHENEFIAVKNGCSASVFDISNKNILSNVNLITLGIDTTSSQSYPFAITFYKNFMMNDGKWTAVITRFMSGTWIVNGNKATKLQTEQCLTHEIRLVNGNLYLVIHGRKNVDTFIVRNNVSLAALPRLEMPKREHSAKGLNLWSDVNPLGQKLTDGSLPRNIKLLR